jgi:hypothetical protein
MARAATFGDVVELADRLSLDEKESLIEELRKRAAAERRAGVIEAVRRARREHRAGRGRVMTPDGIMREVRR